MMNKIKNWFSNLWKDEEFKKTLKHSVFLIAGLMTMPFLLIMAMGKHRRHSEEIEKRKHDQAMRAIFKLYKINITQTFWGVKKEYVMRDIPLTEEQLDGIEIDAENGDYSDFFNA